MVMMIKNENTAKDENQMRTGCSMYPLTLQIDEGVRRKAFTASILIRTGTGAHHPRCSAHCSSPPQHAIRWTIYIQMMELHR